MIAVVTNYISVYENFIRINLLDSDKYKHIQKASDCMGMEFEDYFTCGEFDKEAVKAVIVRIKNTAYFQPDKPKNLAFPKDNFLRTQMDYDGYNNETF